MKKNLRCAAKHLCKLTAIPLTDSDSTKHTCFNCQLRMHAPCGVLWDDFDETKSFKDRFGTPLESAGAPMLELCIFCISDEKAKAAKESQPAMKVSETSASAKHSTLGKTMSQKGGRGRKKGSQNSKVKLTNADWYLACSEYQNLLASGKKLSQSQFLKSNHSHENFTGNVSNRQSFSRKLKQNCA